MERITPCPVTDDELHALVDGQVAPEALADLHNRLAQNPPAQETLQQWQSQRDALRELHRGVLSEAVPSTLLTAAQQATSNSQEIDQWWRWGGRAAGLMVAFGVGWFSNTSLQTKIPAGPGQANPLSILASTKTAPAFVKEASIAHAVFTPEVRHPVEVAAAEQAHLIQWLSKRLGKQLKIPSLAEQGYELVGGRLLPGDTGARAQFMFQNHAGIRLTLYLGAIDSTATNAEKDGAAFRFADEKDVRSFYWVDQGFGYALAGQIARQDLMALAQSVYQQL